MISRKQVKEAQAKASQYQPKAEYYSITAMSGKQATTIIVVVAMVFTVFGYALSAMTADYTMSEAQAKAYCQVK